MVEEYAELRERKDTSRRGLPMLVKLADLDRAVTEMPPKEYHAVLLHGLLGNTLRDAERHLGVSRSTLLARYEKGLAWLCGRMNGLRLD